MTNRHSRAAAICMQLQQAEAAGEDLHDCPECASTRMWVDLVEHIEARGADAELVAAVALLERPAAPGVH